MNMEEIKKIKEILKLEKKRNQSVQQLFINSNYELINKVCSMLNNIHFSVFPESYSNHTVTHEQILSINKAFLETFDIEMLNIFLQLQNSNRINFLESNKILNVEGENSHYNKVDGILVRTTHTVDDIITLLHELTHSFSKENANNSKLLFGELSSLIMEEKFIEFMLDNNIMNRTEIENYRKIKLMILKNNANSLKLEHDLLKLADSSEEEIRDYLEKDDELSHETKMKLVKEIISNNEMNYYKSIKYFIGQLIAFNYKKIKPEMIKEIIIALSFPEQEVNEAFKKIIDNVGITLNNDFSLDNNIAEQLTQYLSTIKTEKIEMTDGLESCLDDIVQTSLLSSREALEKYSSNPDFAMQMQRAQQQGKVLLAQLQQLRQSNPNMTDAVFYQNAMASFLIPVIKKISTEYGQIIPQEKLQKLQGLMNPQNITFTNDPNQNDIQANSDKGTIVINPQKTNGSTLEEKIVSSMSVSIHELFHLLVNMLKSPEQAEALGERLMYTVATQDGDKEVHFAPGKYGQVLSEGFVEKLSSEFAQKNGFFYTLNPSYVSYVNLCTQLMKQDKSIDMPTLFTTNGDKIVEKMSPEVKTKFESAERLAVINNFSVKEAKKDPTLKAITSENVKSSWMEVNDKKVSVSKNTTYKRPLESTEKKQEEHFETKSVESKPTISRGPEVKSFSWKSNSEAMVYSQIKQKNQMIKQQKAKQKEMNKAKVKTLTPSSQDGNGIKGFTNVVLLSLIVSFIAGALFMVMYMLLAGK